MLTDYPELRLSDYQYWINLVSRLGFDTSVYHPSSRSPVVPSEILNQYFDSTEQRLLRISHFFDRGKGQTFFAQEAAEELQSHGIYTSRGSPKADAAFQELIDMIWTPRNGSKDGTSSSAHHSHTPEFLVALRNLRLAALVHHEKLTGQDMCMNLHEYGETRLNSYYPINNPIAFLFNPASELFSSHHSQAQVCKTTGQTCRPVKLLHVHDASKNDILGLTIKYQLEPEYVKDLFTLWIQEPKAILENTRDTHSGATDNAAAAASVLNMGKSGSASPPFGSTPNLPNLMGAPSNDLAKLVFIIVPVLRLSEHSRNTLRKYQAWQECGMPQTSAKGVSGDTNSIVEEALGTAPCVDINVERCNLAMFVSGIPGGSTVILFSSKCREIVQFNSVRMNVEQRSAERNWCFVRRANYIPAGRSSAGGRVNPTAIGSKHSGTRNTPSDRVSGTNPSPMSSKVLNELRTSSNQLRCGDAQTFLLIELRDITEDYLLISLACKACLLILQEWIDKDPGNICSKEVGRITEYIEELSRLKRNVERVPMIVETISTRTQWSGDAVSYLYAIRSNVSSFLDDLSTCKNKAESILEKYRKANASRFLDTIILVMAMFIFFKFLKFLCGLNVRPT